MGDGFSVELVIFFFGGDVILAATSAAVRFFLKSKNKQKGKS
jgi:hypothetical protein